MKTVRARFRCSSVKKEDWGTVASFDAVTGPPGSDDNVEWSKYTPSGYLTLTITNPPAEAFYVEGQDYYLDMSDVRSHSTDAEDIE